MPTVLAASIPVAAAGSASRGQPRVEVGEAPTGAVRLEGVDAEYLRRYDQCAFRAWGERVLLPAGALDGDESQADEAPGAADDWYRLIGALTASRSWTAEGLAELGERFPDMSAWLQEHAERLTGLTWGTELTDPVTGVRARLHAGERVQLGKRAARGKRRTEKAVIYRFVEPTTEPEWRWAADKLRDRWTEYLAAGIMLEHRSQAPNLVEFVVWPLLGEPLVVDNTTGDFSFRQLSSVRAKARAAAERFALGEVEPSPGWVCRDCPVFEICRVGQRS